MYHPHCIMIFSQYFSLSLSVSFHHYSILNHPFTTHDVKCLSPGTSVSICHYHSNIAPYPTMYQTSCIMFSPSTSVFPCEYHSTIAPYPSTDHKCFKMFFSPYFSVPMSLLFHHRSISIHPPPTLYNVFLPVLQFSPVSIIPPLLHIHPSTTHAVKCFSTSTSVFPCQYHSTIALYPSIYHSSCKMFFSQYLSFPL